MTGATKPKPILIVDDEEIVLVALRDTLLREGYEVVASPHAVHALSVLRQRPFAVVITDQQMPLVSGLEFLGQVREIQPHAARILITAVLNFSTMIDAINKAEVHRFIVKPWMREELLAIVKHAMERHDLLARTDAINAGLAQLCSAIISDCHPRVGDQIDRVAEICEAMAAPAGLSPEQRKTLAVASRIYDAGLAGMPHELVERWQVHPHKLTEAEWTVIRRHPIIGQEMFAADAEIGAVIRQHHERYDGTGYPDGIQGGDIPWLARLLGVAVAYAGFDRTAKDAAAMLQGQAGSAFDPEAVRVLMQARPAILAG